MIFAPPSAGITPVGVWPTWTCAVSACPGSVRSLAAEKPSRSLLPCAVTQTIFPTGVAASPDGKMVWVTAQGSNDLLGFSAAKLRTDPGHALTAQVQVGQTPTGVMPADGGAKIIVADSNLNGLPGADNLAVVNVAAAIARKPALIGYIPSGRSPL